MGKGSEHPKGKEATVATLPQREHRPREGCLDQGGWREKKRVSMGRQRRNKTTPEGIGDLSNPSDGGSGKETYMGSPEPIARSKKSSTTSGRQQLNTAGWQVWGETLLTLFSGAPGPLIPVH